MAVTSNKLAWETEVSSTGGITSLATSADWTAGYEWFIIDNTTDLDFDYIVQGTVRVGTTPTTATQIRIYAVGSYDGTTWPDTITGSAGARTWTSAGVRDSVAKMAAVLSVDSTNSNRDYFFLFPVSPLFGGTIPKKISIFVTQNTGQNLNSTGSTQKYAYVGGYTTNQ
jgi:hypothetical protein